MSSEQPTNVNQAAEQDVQNVLAELQGETATDAPAPAAAEQQTETAAATEDSTASAPVPADTEAEEEARVIAAAQKIGQEAADKDGKTEDKQQQQKGRGGIQRTRGGLKKQNFRENVKSDLTSGEITSDPEEIRKQVRNTISKKI